MGTLSFFEEAKIDFKKNNYLKSAQLFEKAIKKEGLSLDDQVYSWEKIRKIYENLKKEISLNSLYEISKVYREAKLYNKAGQVLFELYERTNKAFYLRESFQNALENGAIKEAKDFARSYIKHLIKEKRPDDILQFITENNDKLDKSEVKIWRVSSYLLSGNRNAFVEEMLNNEKEVHLEVFLLQELIRYSEKKTNYWQSDNRILKRLFSKLSNQSTNILISRKQVSKLIFNAWMEEAINQDLIIDTVKLCERYSLFLVGIAIADYMGDAELSKKFSKEAGQDILMQEVDFGEDLFGEEEISEEEMIVRNIELLRTLGKEADVEKELKKLEKINPRHSLIQGSIEDDNVEPEHLYRDLMSELSQYTRKEDAEDSNDVFNNLANFYEWEYVQDNYEDMIVGLNLISLPQVAINLAERVDTKLLNEEERINIEYLKLETLMLLKKYFAVRDGVDDMINNFPIKGNELLSLLYLRAEALLALKHYKSAYYAFLEISKISSTYRLVGQRLKELEKHK